MLNVVYLVLVMHSSGNQSRAMKSVQIPQASMRQCEINKNAYSNKNDKLIIRSYCIAGVMPK